MSSPSHAEITTPALLAHDGPWGAIIDGREVVPEEASTFSVAAPATGEDIAEVVAADDALVDQAVASSLRAFETGWRHLAPRERAAAMREVAEVIRRNASELEQLEAHEVGKPLHIAAGDVRVSHTSFDYYSTLADTLHGDLNDHGLIESHTVFEPYGVVAGILPFNWPPNHFARKSAPALLAGNTVVIKPGEQAPLTALKLVELANTVLPPGVVNAVSGIGAGPALVGHPDVSRVSFTGASATGRRVLETAAKNITFTTVELGGKGPLIIFDDADPEMALRVAIEGMFYNQGEACSSTSRIIVHESIHDEFVERFSRAALELVMGDGLDPRSELGAMVDARQRDRVMGYIDTAVAEGATIFAQGTVPQESRYRDGFWVPVTVLTNVDPHSTVGQEEIFGPVACILTFRTEEEAIRIANDNPYGLYAGVVSGDEARARRVALQIEAGVVYVNNYYRRGAPGTPSGGVKASGFGRESWAGTLHEYVRSKNVRIPTGRGEIPTWPPLRGAGARER